MTDLVIPPLDPVVERVRVFKDTDGEWRWHAQAGNGKIVAVSGEGLKNHSDCYGVALRMFPYAKFIDEAEPGTP